MLVYPTILPHRRGRRARRGDVIRSSSTHSNVLSPCFNVLKPSYVAETPVDRTAMYSIQVDPN
ncbi:hypothetical protein M413DRAFT_30847 [Hebeloma cylindrosporum]|uniref:Uncharacterized protein n=1 Tax=Hebeloma cylindrosporum TaxID=76867 RepID=A0A0C2XIP6_HEBCY|nr:hypothetical protein M413DRAFT_30847 [Hebeloma cylindrosporum h7]